LVHPFERLLGGPTRFQEAPGDPQEVPGDSKRLNGVSGGASREFQEAPGGQAVRDSKRAPGDRRRLQQAPGGSRRPQRSVAPGVPQETPKENQSQKV
jgi:hypothetical protein